MDIQYFIYTGKALTEKREKQKQGQGMGYPYHILKLGAIKKKRHK